MDKFLQGLEILGLGMLAIFIVMTVIFIVVKLLNYFTNKEKMAQLKAKILSLKCVAKFTAKRAAKKQARLAQEQNKAAAAKTDKK